jgi:hypothetical protein
MNRKLALSLSQKTREKWCDWFGHDWEPKSYDRNGFASYWWCKTCGHYHWWKDEREHEKPASRLDLRIAKGLIKEKP